MTLQRTTTSGDGESGGAGTGLGGPAPATRHDHLLMRQAAEALQAAGEPLSAADLAGQLGARRGRPPVAPRSTPPAHLVQRLEAALAQDSVFVRDAAGLWGLASWRSADDTSSPLLAEYAVLDATLPSGMRDGAIRLAGVRLRAGQIVDPYFVRFRPAPPREPETAGGAATLRLQAPATGGGAAGQRPASAVLPEVRGWLGAAVVVGQDVRQALGALSEQAERCEQALFDNRLLELADLAQLLLPGARRPSLMRLADALGVAPRLRHPSLGDARLIAELLLAVLRRLDGRGGGGGGGEALFGWISGGPAGGAAGASGGAAPGGDGENPGGIWPAGPAGAENRPGERPAASPPPGAVFPAAPPAPAAPAGPVGPGRPIEPAPAMPPPPGTPQPWLARRPGPAPAPAAAAAQRSLRIERNTDGLADETVRDLPVAPGVYVFRDDNGRVLFVGTADSLRSQIASHFLPDPDRGEPNSPWADQATAVEHTAADCELDAMLLAAERLRSIHPAFRQRGARRYSPMLRFVGGTFLRAEPSHAVEQGETYHFGPYRSEAELRHTVQTMRRVFQIRTCSRRLPARRPAMRIPCERLAQGLCPAPCADLVTPEQYDVLVDLAHLFVAAGKAAALQAIGSRLDALEAGDEAGGWEHTILAECRTRLLRVRKEYRPLPGGFGGGGLVMTYPTADGRLAVFYVQDGQFRARFRVSADEGAGGGLLPLIEAHLSAQGAPTDLDLAQTNVLLRWIFQHAGDPSLAPVLPEHGPDGLGGVIVERIRQHFTAPGVAPTDAPAPDAPAGAPQSD